MPFNFFSVPFEGVAFAPFLGAPSAFAVSAASGFCEVAFLAGPLEEDPARRFAGGDRAAVAVPARFRIEEIDLKV